MTGKRDFLSVTDFTPDEVREVIDLSIQVKKDRSVHNLLEGKSFALIFEKPSLRTRTTFEIAIHELGGYPIYLAPGDIKLGKRESVPDVAHNLERWTYGIVARVFKQSTVETLAANYRYPVINALSDIEHPCQAIGDYVTIKEHAGDTKVKLSFIGDGNNVANSLMLLTAMLGGEFTIACPEGYEPNAALIVRAMDIARETGARIRIVRDPIEAVKDADFIYTDVWTSMGQEEEAEIRRRVFAPYQVNEELMSHAPKHAKVMHCLPARRGEEITDGVIDGPQSIVFDQAENRLHSEKGILMFLYGLKI